MSWCTWILHATGATVIVDPDDIAYIEENTADPTTCFVGLVAGGNARIEIDRTAALAAADVHTATGIVVGGYPVAPLVEVAKTGEPTRSLFFRGSTVASLTAQDVAETLVDTQGPEQPWSVAVAAATLSTDLQAAAGAAPSAQVAPLVLAVAAFNGATGARLNMTVWNGLAIDLAADSGYTPGSGSYAFNLTGADVPATVFTATNIGQPPPAGVLSSYHSAGVVHCDYKTLAGAAADADTFEVFIIGVAP